MSNSLKFTLKKEKVEECFKHIKIGGKTLICNTFHVCYTYRAECMDESSSFNNSPISDKRLPKDKSFRDSVLTMYTFLRYDIPVIFQILSLLLWMSGGGGLFTL
jgi:hypothetical protein